MKKYIILTLITAFALLLLGKVFAGLLVTEDLKVPQINFNDGATELTILKGSEAGSFLATNGSFKVTNPVSENGFNVAALDSNVKSILLTKTTGEIVSCTLNEKPGESYLHVNDLKGTYNIVPSKIDSCEEALSKSTEISSILQDYILLEASSNNQDISNDISNVVMASFFDDMSDDEKKILFEVAKIAAIVIVGQIF